MLDIVPFQAKLERFCYSNDIQSVAFANIENSDFKFKNFSKAMVLGQSFGNDLMENFDNDIFKFHIKQIERHLSDIAYRIYHFLIIEGYNALILPPFFFRNSNKFSNLNKKTAQLAGMGFIGKNDFFLSPTYGVKMVLCSILTNAPLETDEEYKINLCKECGICDENNFYESFKKCPYGKDKLK